jgi:hypothetical protein
MAHRVAPGAEADLDDVWLYVVRESGSIEIADRLIETITTPFLTACWLSLHGTLARGGFWDLAVTVSPSVST